jgi:pimeloyl-ACP methyl ester carboxylesterase
VNDELAEVRYRGSIQPGFQESFSAMFPAPRQRWVEAMCTPEDDIRRLPHRTLIIHGREDQVIPVQTSLRLMELIENADLSVFSCKLAGPFGHSRPREIGLSGLPSIWMTRSSFTKTRCAQPTAQ